MDTNEIIDNENVMEVTEDIVRSTSTDSRLIIAAVAGIAVISIVVYNKAIRPIAKKIRDAVVRRRVENAAFGDYDSDDSVFEDGEVEQEEEIDN